MKTDGGWVSISECARLYGRHRKWVYDQIKRYGIETHKEGNRTRLRLADLIQHRGEPQNGAPAHNETHTEESQKITHELTREPTPEREMLRQENQFLQKRIEELEADRSERQAREARWDGGTVAARRYYREADLCLAFTRSKAGHVVSFSALVHGAIIDYRLSKPKTLEQRCIERSQGWSEQAFQGGVEMPQSVSLYLRRNQATRRSKAGH